MKVLLFPAKGFETMEASVFVDIMGWAGIDSDVLREYCTHEVTGYGYRMI